MVLCLQLIASPDHHPQAPSSLPQVQSEDRTQFILPSPHQPSLLRNAALYSTPSLPPAPLQLPSPHCCLSSGLHTAYHTIKLSIYPETDEEPCQDGGVYQGRFSLSASRYSSGRVHQMAKNWTSPLPEGTVLEIQLASRTHTTKHEMAPTR